MIKLKVVNKSKNELPEYAHPGDSGLDIRANLEEAVILQPLERKLIPTGIYVFQKVMKYKSDQDQEWL